MEKRLFCAVNRRALERDDERRTDTRKERQLIEYTHVHTSRARSHERREERGRDGVTRHPARFTLEDLSKACFTKEPKSPLHPFHVNLQGDQMKRNKRKETWSAIFCRHTTPQAPRPWEIMHCHCSLVQMNAEGDVTRDITWPSG